MRLERGEEAIEALTSLVTKNKIPCGFLQGIGTIDNVELGYFDVKAKRYKTKKIKQTLEVVSLLGNISYKEKKPFVHVHVSLADSNQKLVGGHFFRGTVAVTLEIFIRVVKGKLNRFQDREMGFYFWDL